MPLQSFLWAVFGVALPANVFCALMYWARVRRPERAALWGGLALLLGIPALVIALLGMLNNLGALYWLMPLLYALFCAVCWALDYWLKIEFRRPRRPVILVPFLILFYVPLIGMWGMLWGLSFLPWALAGLAYFANLGGAAYAGRRGVG